LAKVMSEANEYDNSPVQVGRGTRNISADLGQPAGTPDASRARRSGPTTRALGLSARRAGRPGEAHGDDPRRARRAREGAAAVDHQGHRLTRRTRPDPADAAFKRPQAGRPHGDRPGARRGPQGPRAARGLAGASAAGPDSGRAGGAEGRGSDSGEAEPVLTAAAAPADAAAAPRRRGTFSSLRVRNFRLFATGQVVSNTGTW